MNNRIKIPVCGGNRREMSIIDKSGTRGNAFWSFNRSNLSVNFIYDLSANLSLSLDFDKT